jgi:hypothetical protein
MQLPRGTFRALKKGVSIRQLLHEMKSSEFTGFCIISRVRVPVTLVLKNGRVLLATYNDLAGEDAWKAILSIMSEEGEAELSDLTDAQIQLSIEFNSRAVVREGDIQLQRESVPLLEKNEIAQEKKPKIPVRQRSTARVKQDTPIPEIINKDHIPVEGLSALDEPEHASLSHEVASARADEATNEDEEAVYQDLKVLDEMDLESMSEKIRANCQVMIKKLNLDHLLEQKDKKQG